MVSSFILSYPTWYLLWYHIISYHILWYLSSYDIQWVWLSAYLLRYCTCDILRPRWANLLSVIRARTYGTLQSLVAPLKPKQKSVDKILQTLTELFDPKPSVIVQQFRFNSRSRQEGESVAKVTAELQRLSKHCEYSGSA